MADLVDIATVNSLAQHWEQGWNNADLETIMAPLAPEVVFTSPFVTRMTGDGAKSAVEGYDALREYIADALSKTSDIRYSLDTAFRGADAVVLVYTYRTPDGVTHRGADSMQLNANGQIVQWRSHYPADDV